MCAAIWIMEKSTICAAIHCWRNHWKVEGRRSRRSQRGDAFLTTVRVLRQDTATNSAQSTFKHAAAARAMGKPKPNAARIPW